MYNIKGNIKKHKWKSSKSVTKGSSTRVLLPIESYCCHWILDSFPSPPSLYNTLTDFLPFSPFISPASMCLGNYGKVVCLFPVGSPPLPTWVIVPLPSIYLFSHTTRIKVFISRWGQLGRSNDTIMH